VVDSVSDLITGIYIPQEKTWVAYSACFITDTHKCHNMTQIRGDCKLCERLHKFICKNPSHHI